MRPFSISECLPRPPPARPRGRFHASDDADRATERQARPRTRLDSCRVAWPPGRAGRPGEAGPAREQARGGHRAPTGHRVSSEDDEAALPLGPSGFSEAGSAREDEPNPNVEIRRKPGGLRFAPSGPLRVAPWMARHTFKHANEDEAAAQKRILPHGRRHTLKSVPVIMRTTRHLRGDPVGPSCDARQGWRASAACRFISGSVDPVA